MVTLGKVVDLTVDSCGGNTGTKKKICGNHETNFEGL